MRAGRLAVAGLRLAVALALSAAVSPASAAKISFASPNEYEAVFGTVEIAVELDVADPLAELVLFVDGSLVARFARPPYRVQYDVGQLNTEHHFVAEATTLFGDRLRATVTTPAIRVGEQIDVELVQLYVGVRNSQGAMLRDLRQDSFHVTDDAGKRLPVTTLAGGEVPISVVVLVDSSESMLGDPFRQAVAGAQTASALLGPEDEVMIALFSDRLLRATDFTRDRGALESALEDVEASGGTAMFDHLYYALNRLKSRLGRPVVIFFSDAEDVTSALDADDIRWRARRSQATLYWIRVEQEDAADRRYATFWRDEPDCRRQRETLEETVRESGGRILRIRSVPELSLALLKVFEELHAQYVVGFHPRNRRHDGNWRPISVSTVEPRARVSAKAGYVDE